MPKLPINGDPGTGTVRPRRLRTPAILLLGGSAVVAVLALAVCTGGGPGTLPADGSGPASTP